MRQLLMGRDGIAALQPSLSLTAIERACRAKSRHLLLPKRRRRYQRADARFV